MSYTTHHWFILLSVFTSSSLCFNLPVISEYACGGLLQAGEGFIESPLFPDLYPPEADCVWTINASTGNRIRMTSEYFSIEHQPECLWDYLAIQDGSDGEFGQAVYCGSNEVEFLSESNVIVVYFHTDISGSDIGFRLDYEAIPSSERSESDEATSHFQEESVCNMTLREEGNITSPGYPGRYPALTTCFYHVQAPANHKIKLTFSDFHLETSPCDFDKLEVYEGHIVADKPIGIFCGLDIPPAVTSESNGLTLIFVSDKTIQSDGFKASVDFIASSKERPITSTLPPPPPSTQIPTLTSSQSENTHREKQNSTENENILTEETTTNQSRNADSERDMTEEGCNSTIFSSRLNETTPGVPLMISSPGFPDKYPYDVHCVTKFRSDVISSFLIRFLNFSLEEGENCAYDSLSIYQAGPDNSSSVDSSTNLIQRLCGNDLGDLIVTWEGHGLDLVFHSDMSVNDVGYLAQVIIAPVTHQNPSCPATCENGGTCVEILLADGAVDWKCSCAKQYTGTLCENVVRETCYDLHCQNDGVCQDDGSTVTCVCPNGYKGRLCEQLERLTDDGSLYFTKMVKNMSVSVGSSVILECSVNDPTAHVMWLFQDRIMANADWSRGVEVHPGGVVVIPEVKDEHSGRYTCMAVTSGDLVERSMWIELTEPCSLHVTKSPRNITIREGQTALFECYIPDADVTLWRKDGNIIKQGPRKRILVNQYLVITPVVETDAGQYTCSARAKSGCFAQVTAYLTVENTGHGLECGRALTRPEIGGTGRISSGREAPKGSAPWHAILREEKKDTTFCGGSLISKDTVLTAAHCVGQFEETFGYPFHPRHIHIYLGTHHCIGHHGIYRQVKSYILHESFNNTHYNNDLALFKLDQPVEYTDDVMPICLETPEFLEELLTPGKLGVVTGCGGQVAHGREPTYLHEVQIPYVSRDICRERAASVNTTFTPGMFCAGYARSMRGDACAGDSGGPYVLEFSGRFVQAGIVSWGVGCDRENHYGYYTSLSHYYSWIMEKLG